MNTRNGLIWKGWAPLLAGGSALVALGLGAGCLVDEPLACTLIGCGAAFQVVFDRSGWEAGDYEIAVTADGQATLCTVTLPFASCDARAACDRAAPGFFVELSGCALDAVAHRIGAVSWPSDGPAAVSVELRQDGNVIGTGSYAPTYETSYPNGEQCDPACRQATADATIVLP